MNLRESKSSLRRWFGAALLLGLALNLTACPDPKSSKNSGSGIYNPGCPGCVGPVGTGTILAAAIGLRADPNQSIELGLRVHAPNTGFPAWAYYGPVVSTGYVKVATANWGGCAVIPPGYYQIQTYAANGNYAPDTSYQAWNLMNFDFEAVHTSGFRARFHVNYAEFFDQGGVVMGPDGGQYPHLMYGEILIAPLSPAPSCYFGPVKLFFPRPY